jgi:RNA polymerase-interacting CarD/CdnL/TRCF family regulator
MANDSKNGLNSDQIKSVKAEADKGDRVRPDPLSSTNPDGTRSILTEIEKFRENINEVKNTKVIETDSQQYLNTALDYSEIQKTSDFKNFIRSNEQLLANPEIKAQLSELADLWKANGVSSPPAGELKEKMAATAQKIANAEFPVIDRAKSETLADALSAANTQANLEQLAKDEPFLEGAVLLKKIQLTVREVAKANPSLLQADSTQDMMKIDGAKVIADTGVLPQSDAKTVQYFNDLKALAATVSEANEISSRYREPTELNP